MMMMMMRNNGSQQKMADTVELEVKLFKRSHQESDKNLYKLSFYGQRHFYALNV